MADELFNNMTFEKSRKSCKVANIESFIYGPLTSRFWILRKHICLVSIRQLCTHMSFYAWDCLTICVKNQEDICLIIKDQQLMMKIIQFLIFQLKTIDGRKDSAYPLIRKLMSNEQVKNGKFYHYNTVEYLRLEKKATNHMTIRTLSKYKLLRVK